MHHHGDNLPDVPHFFLREVEDFHGSADYCEILLVPHVSSVVLVDDVTAHCVALETNKKKLCFFEHVFCSVYSQNEKNVYLGKVLVFAWVLDKVEFFEVRS